MWTKNAYYIWQKKNHTWGGRPVRSVPLEDIVVVQADEGGGLVHDKIARPVAAAAVPVMKIKIHETIYLKKK